MDESIETAITFTLPTDAYQKLEAAALSEIRQPHEQAKALVLIALKFYPLKVTGKEPTRDASPPTRTKPTGVPAPAANGAPETRAVEGRA